MDDAHERFVGLYDACYRRVLGYALQHLDADAAQDVASETFLIAWRQLPQVPEPPLAWLLAVARNLLRQQYGAATRRRRLEARISALTSEDDMLAWDAGEHATERAAALEAFAALPRDDIEVLTLTTWHGLSPAGALLGGPASRSTKAALCRLLAAQPGIQVVPQVTDPLGRTGVAIGDGTGSYLIIDQRTGQLLATTSGPVHAGSAIPAAAGATEAIITEGWTGTLGTPAG